MKEIRLSQNQVAIIDDIDVALVEQYKWYAKYCKATHTYYAYTNIWLNGRKTTLQMHRLIMGAATGEGVDHVDHEGLRNNRSNLRKCTTSQNMANRRMPINNTSGYKGVCFDKTRGLWMAQIVILKKHCTIGRFENQVDAARAYDDRAIECFGVFALTNKALGLLEAAAVKAEVA